MISCFLNCRFLTTFIFVVERKAHNTYLQIHLNFAFSSVGGVGMFANKLVTYFELLFTPKHRTEQNFAMSVSGLNRVMCVLALQ
jgi:hypothetical protein